MNLKITRNKLGLYPFGRRLTRRMECLRSETFKPDQILNIQVPTPTL